MKRNRPGKRRRRLNMALLKETAHAQLEIAGGIETVSIENENIIMFKTHLLYVVLLLSGCVYDLSDYAAENSDSYYAGGDGTSFEQAVFFPGVKSSKEAKPLKQKWLSAMYPDHQRQSQGIMAHDNKVYDRIVITTRGGEEKTVYFDMTPIVGLYGRNK